MKTTGLHLVMPMGGSGSRFYKNGISIPKPMLTLKGRPFFYWAARSITKYNDIADITFVILQKHIDEFGLDGRIIDYFPEARIIVIPEVLPGPVFTCIKGGEGIRDGLPIIFNDCDHLFKSSVLNQALTEALHCDGGLVSFHADEPQFSYIKFENGRIVGTAEKAVVSTRAICGAYLFKDRETFLTAARQYIQECSAAECFMSGVYNTMCRNGLSVEEFEADYHINFGTPVEYEQAKEKRFFDLD